MFICNYRPHPEKLFAGKGVLYQTWHLLEWLWIYHVPFINMRFYIYWHSSIFSPSELTFHWTDFKVLIFSRNFFNHVRNWFFPPPPPRNWHWLITAPLLCLFSSFTILSPTGKTVQCNKTVLGSKTERCVKRQPFLENLKFSLGSA